MTIHYLRSMAYYVYDSTANFSSLGCKRFYAYQKNGTVTRSYVRGVENFDQ